MSAIVKANASLTSGGISRLRQSINTDAQGRVEYSADFVCLASFANNWKSYFVTGAEPPVAISARLIDTTQFTSTPKLYSVQSESLNGLAYFYARYSAGIKTDIEETVTSEQRNLSYTRPDGFPASFDYISVSVTRSSMNNTLDVRAGSVGAIFNTFNCDANLIRSNQDPQVFQTTIDSASSVKSTNGTYRITTTSSGVYVARQYNVPQSSTPTQQKKIYNAYPNGVPWGASSW